MKLISMTTLLLSIAGSTLASPAGELYDALEKSQSHQVRFTQTLSIDGLDDARREEGTVLFGVLPRMRWNYTSPYEKLFVFDGRTSWLYVPSEKQVLIHEVTDRERAELPFLFLRDPKWIEQNFDARAETRGARRVIRMNAKKTGSTIRSIVAEIDRKDGRIRLLTWTDLEGNRTRFELSNYQKTDAPAARFRFVPPPGTDVVTN